jgi:hypothetical protein
VKRTVATAAAAVAAAAVAAVEPGWHRDAAAEHSGAQTEVTNVLFLQLLSFSPPLSPGLAGTTGMAVRSVLPMP